MHHHVLQKNSFLAVIQHCHLGGDCDHISDLVGSNCGCLTFKLWNCGCSDLLCCLVEDACEASTFYKFEEQAEWFCWSWASGDCWSTVWSSSLSVLCTPLKLSPSEDGTLLIKKYHVKISVRTDMDVRCNNPGAVMLHIFVIISV